MRNITLEGKIIIFKPLALSKIVFLTLITSFSKQINEEIQKIQLFCDWCKYLSPSVNISSSILSQPIWYNKSSKINNKAIYTEELAKQNIIFLYDLLTLKMGLKSGMK